MRTFKDIKLDYNFTEKDERRLGALKELMTEHADEAMDTLHSWILDTKETAEYFTEQTRKQHVFGAQRKWFLSLFSGAYDNRYYDQLIRIGQTHVKASVDAHYMNLAVNLLRNYSLTLINHNIDDTEERIEVLRSIEKILDINLDIITASYIEAGLKAYSPTYRVRNTMITFAEQFSHTMNLVLVLALIGLTLGAVVMFVADIQKLITGNLEHGIISALGTVLILWVMIRLMATEISLLKGGKFNMSVFIGVALITIIRETMIATLKHDKPETIYYLIAAVLVTGVVYWLVKRTEVQ